ncbi:hypothetical protein FACS1894193_06550 [Bacilli bacterium]|nr:hypothetical protein FACS1894193_06550 [Bacilli bacterium]
MQEYPITTFNEMHIRVKTLYEKFAPAEVKYCKNKHLAYSPLNLLSVWVQFPSRTRFIRTCNNLKQTLELINQD